MTRRRQPPRERQDLRVWMQPQDMERLEVLCMKRSLRRPFRDVSLSTVARYAVLKYLEEAEEREEHLGRRRLPCIAANCTGGLRWCPEHDARWQDGAEVPETCRGDE